MDELRTILTRLYTKYGPEEPPSGPTTPPELPCERCGGHGWYLVKRPVPGQSLPDYKATVCETCEANETLLERQARMWSLSGLDQAELRRGTFEQFNAAANPGMTDALAAARAWGQATAKPFLLMAGTRGLGKTHLAIAAATACMERGEAVAFLNLPLYMQSLRVSSRNYQAGEPAEPAMDKLLHRAMRYPAVILDDLGMERMTDFACEQVYLLIDTRYRAERRTLITTNRRPGDLEPSIASRIQDWRLSRVVRCEGDDYRARRPS